MKEASALMIVFVGFIGLAVLVCAAVVLHIN